MLYLKITLLVFPVYAVMMNNCSNQSPCNDTCDKLHHSSLHSDTFNGTLHTVVNDAYNDTVIQPIMKVRVNSRKCPYLNVLWDSGSSVSLITNRKAKEMKLKGKAVTICITTAGGVETILYSNKYQLPLVDSGGRIITLSVYGIEKITNKISSINVENLCVLFHNISHIDISSHSGIIDILVGYDYAIWHPVKEQGNNQLVLLSNCFGKCIAGHNSNVINNAAEKSVVVNHLRSVTEYDISCDFFSIESLGVQCIPKCGSCRCGSCPVGSKAYTLKEEQELNMISKGLPYDGTYWVATYPWTCVYSLIITVRH